MLLETEQSYLISAEPDWIVESGWREDSHKWRSSKTHMLHYERQVHQALRTDFYRIVDRFDSLGSVENNSTLDFDFDPKFQKVQLHSLTIFREGEEIDKLPSFKVKIVQKEVRSHEHIYNGIKTAIVILDDIREGDILEYSFSRIDTKSFFKDHFVNRFFVTMGGEVGTIFYRLIGEKDLFIKCHQCECQPTTKSLDLDFSEWIWEIKNSQKANFDSNLPSWYDPVSWIQVSSFATWNDVAKWAESLFDTSAVLSSDIEKKIEEWKAVATDNESLVLRIIRFVQNDIRYLSLDKDFGEYAATDPNEVFQRRFGDCKDKTLLLHHLLKLVEIRSYPALVSTNWRDRVLERHPSPSPFNHAILRFEFDGKLYWVDPTKSFQGGKLSNLSSPVYKYGLVVGNPLLSLEPIPEEKNNKGLVESKTTFDLGSNGSSTMSVEVRYHGSDADSFRAQQKGISPEQLSNNYKDFYNKHYKGVSATKPVEIEDYLDENFIRTKESYQIREHGEQKELPHIYQYIFTPFLIHQWLVTNIDVTRVLPIALPYPLEVREEIFIDLSSPICFEQTFEEIENDYIKFKSKSTNVDNMAIRLEYSLSYLTDSVKAKDLGDVRRVMDQISSSLSQVLTLNSQPNLKKKKASPFFVWDYVIFFVILFLILIALFS